MVWMLPALLKVCRECLIKEVGENMKCFMLSTGQNLRHCGFRHSWFNFQSVFVDRSGCPAEKTYVGWF